jgi:hypothetical protein
MRGEWLRSSRVLAPTDPSPGPPVFASIGIYTSPLGSRFRWKPHGAVAFVRVVVLPHNPIRNTRLFPMQLPTPLTRPAATLSPRTRGERAG